ncbi:MAG: DUF1847 domain-containing protein, partial [Coriobacteriales bacterium]|nr:DUF1847 domain-containing protein [Coriobacteriales bacterium]
MDQLISCANCGVFNCDHPDAAYPTACLTTDTPDTELQEVLAQYRDDPRISSMFQAAAEIEGLYYGQLTRVEEVVLFAKKLGVKKLGIATCMGLIYETKTFVKVLQAKGIESVCAVACKVGGIDKSVVDIPEDVKVRPGNHESTCNPILQAHILNKAGTDLNVVVGLCVGHDTLFIKHSEAPVTYLLVKDRVLAHNPVGALYGNKFYYRRIMTPDLPQP